MRLANRDSTFIFASTPPLGRGGPGMSAAGRLVPPSMSPEASFRPPRATMKIASLLALLAVLLTPVAPAFAQDASEESQLARGKVVYDVWCIICHGENDHASGGGTAALEFLYRGALPAKLEDRTDMTAALITELVRRGRFGMPNFRLTEISEQELEDMIAYLLRNNPNVGAGDGSSD